MADAPEIPKDLSYAANGEVKAYDRLGNKITVPKEKVGELFGMGGRPAKKEEVAAQQLEDDYAKKSTIQKVGGFVSPALPLPAQMALRGSGAISLPPELEAYRAGASQSFSGGLEAMATKEAVELVAGKKAAHAFGEQQLRLKEGLPNWHTGGEATGLVAGAIAGAAGGGLGKAAAAVPGAGIGMVGNVVERGAARVLGGLAGKGAIGRALATGGELAARGAAEGALMSGASHVTDQMLGDHELAADKLFASMGTGALGGAMGGFLLGGGGSLAASGGRAALGAARSGIGRALARAGEELAAGIGTKAEDAAGRLATKAEGVAADAAASGRGIAEATGTKTAQESASIADALTRAGSKDVQKGFAYDQAWKAIGAGQGLQSTSFAKSAERYLPNGVKDVGEVIMRKGIINAEDGLISAARAGTPEHMLPKIEAAREAVGQELGAITAASPAKVSGIAVGDAVSKIASQYEASAATRPIGKTLRAFGENLRDSLKLNELGSEIAVQDLIRERKALDKMVFENASLDPSLAIQVKRELRGELEGLIVKALDDASGQVPGQLKNQYKALKHDYTALSIAADAAEDSAARMAKAGSLGLRDMMYGGGNIVSSIGHKLVRERGNAAAAVLLHRMAEMGTITKAIQSFDEAVGRAAQGVLVAPASRRAVESASTEPVRVRAQKAMARVAEIQANPQAYVEHMTRATEGMSSTAPMLAGALTQRATDAAAFMASKIPVKADRDPLDPHPAPKLSDSQAASVAQYAWYAEKPIRFFQEAEAGKITYEGVETAKALMPRAFAEMQSRTMEGLADMLARGQSPPHRQRERLGMLLDFPAVPAQRPEHMRLLQSNVAPAKEVKPKSAPAPKRPLPTKSQPSALDRLSENGPGRR